MENICPDSTKHVYFSKFKNLVWCCGIKLSFAVKFIALFDITLSIIWIIQLSRIFPTYLDLNWTSLNESCSKNGSILQTFWGFYLVKSVATIFLSILLFNAEISRNVRKFKLWIFIISVVFVSCMAVSIVHVSIYYDGNRAGLIIFIIVATSVYRPYSIMIVWKFMKSLRLAGRSNSSSKNLKDREVEMFFNGSFRHFQPPPGFGDVEKAEHGPYNTYFEISRDCLNIDEENPLEKTESDLLLLKGNMKLPSGSSILVAVKTTTNNVDVAHFRAILSELKIMTYVSSVQKHENIVELLGAVTCDIAQRKIMIILEYFPYGNFHQFLKSHRGAFVNLVRNGTLSRDYAVQHYCNVQQVSLKSSLVTTFSLLRWSFEICNALKYLASIGVVHAGICTKNIYLTEDKVAKISIPALPSQLHRYSSYDASEEQSFWRWMSIESLRDMTFTTRSDVWTIGITIYEIFTLGSVPFHGLSWTPDFVNYLIRGLRMNKPAFAPHKLYTVLLECWDNDPSRRPCPEQLCTFFEGILREHKILDNHYLADVTGGGGVSDDNISTDSSCIATPLGSA
ncbi:receptor-like tyrosine-protein kinase kin-16 isoform X1 [Folsomia candida]|uniref:receptor-like tyrosine-protein kinase kin-16 isoform X1 n=1 Tax=Folsomia candida TaxID=158441 RepID=UPI001604BB93|nr:receptor-like tyrosine-protein kinase kin-16 isoform X1 [Folsomia candida]